MPDLLQLWERCSPVMDAARALSVLTAAYPDGAFDEMSVGDGDALLLGLRAQTFGDELSFRSACSHCECPITGTVQTRDLLVATDGGPVEDIPATLQVDGYWLELRRTTLGDLREAAKAANAAEAVAVLQQRCVTRAEQDGQPVEVRDLPPAVVEAVSERLAELDPQADPSLRLTCPDCGQEWQAAFDVAAYFWEEIANEAPRLLRQVHALARAYGWREADILAMTPVRRQMYLELIDGG